MSVAVRLSVMMFLEYLIWGAWLPLMSLHLRDTLKFTSLEIAYVFATQAIASVFALFLGGQIADRYLPGEKLLALCHLLGGIAMFALSQQKTFWPFFAIMLVYQLLYVLTLSVTNAIAFHHLQGREREFGRVRLWGTIGWIAASWPFYFLLQGVSGVEAQNARALIFVVAGLASLALGIFSFVLPKTPPAPGRTEANAPLEALRLLAVPAFAVLFLVTLLDAMVHQCFFQFTGEFLAHAGLPENQIMVAMSISQIAEIPTMFALGYFLKRLGWRRVMAFGILGHAVRFFVFAIGDPVALMVGINVVHGVCYAFFFASVYIFVDEYFPRDSRASAQSLFNLLILGLGPLLGGFLWGYIGDQVTVNQVVDYRRLFVAPATLALLAMVILLLFFHPKERPASAPV